MTIQQIRTVLLTAELGSITAAARELAISQPNASSSIKLIEDEIGFPIFSRTSAGTILTRKGELFLEHARQILEQNKKIMMLQKSEDIFQLRVIGSNYSPILEAFLRLCADHKEDAKADFSYLNMSVSEGIAAIVSRKMDILMVPLMKHQVVSIVDECKRNNLIMESLCVIPAVLLVRKGHPASLDDRCKNIKQGSSAMKDFPYVFYRDLNRNNGITNYDDSNFVECSYRICVDSSEARLRLISMTNAFGFGLNNINSVQTRYNLQSFPVPGVTAELFAIVRPGENKRIEIQEYLMQLRNIMQTVVGSVIYSC